MFNNSTCFREKVCVFFSLMLGNISSRLHAYPGNMMASNILQFAKSLSEEIDKGLLIFVSNIYDLFALLIGKINPRQGDGLILSNVSC